MRRITRGTGLLAAGALLLIAACGGGGGGGGNGSQGPNLTVSTTSIEKAADAGTPSKPEASFEITVSDAPASGVSIGGNFSQNGIDNVTLNPTSRSKGVVTIFFKDPSIVGPGDYQDRVQLGICRNDSCSAIRDGTLRTVDVAYTVTGTPPSISVATNRVEVQGIPYTVEVPLETVAVTLQGIDPTDVNIDTQYSEHGLQYASVNPDGSGGLVLQLAFQSPTALGFGTYEDTVTVNVCAVPSCPAGLHGSPFVVTTRFDVNHTVSGPNGYTIREVAATAAEAVWDPVSRRIYLSSPASAAENPGSIVPLDPETGALGAAAAAGGDPIFGAVSGDGQFLYIGHADASTIRRFRLPGLVADITLSIGSSSSGPLFAGDIQVIPGDPHGVAVARSAQSGKAIGYDVAIFDDAVQRPNTVQRDDLYFASTQFGATPDVLYGGDGLVSFMDVDAGGVTLAGTADFNVGLGPARIHYEAGILYTDRGLAIDPVAGTLIGTYGMGDFEAGVAAAPDAAMNRNFILVSNGFGYVVRSYDLATFAPIAEIPIYGVRFPAYHIPRMIRWGEDGLAMPTDDGRVILVTGPFVKP